MQRREFSLYLTALGLLGANGLARAGLVKRKEPADYILLAERRELLVLDKKVVSPYGFQGLSARIDNLGLSALKRATVLTLSPQSATTRMKLQHSEMVTLVLVGSLEYTDSMGNVSVLQPGDVHVVTAGEELEFNYENPLKSDSTIILQMTLQSKPVEGLTRCQHSYFAPEMRLGRFFKVLANDGAPDALLSEGDYEAYLGLFNENDEEQYVLGPDRMGYLYVVEGNLRVSNIQAQAGSALVIKKSQAPLFIQALDTTKVVFFDLPRI